MMRRLMLFAALFCALGASQPNRPSKSGIDLASLDASVRPQDDLFAHVNGLWVAKTEVPPDRVSYGTFIELADRAEADIRDIIEEAASSPQRRPGTIHQQVADLYASMMDEARIEELGSAPIRPELDRIDAIQTPSALAAEMGHLSALGAGGPFPASVELDAADPTIPVVRLSQGGTMLPERDYYLGQDAEFVQIREKYRIYLARLFALVGREDPEALGQAVLALETQLASAQWSPVESRSGVASNRLSISKLASEMPGFDWWVWAKPQGIDRTPGILLAQPSFFKTFAVLVRTVPLDHWKAWLVARYVTASAPFLSRPFLSARFDFFGTVLSGQELPRTRWKRGVSLVNGYLGDAVGRLYAQKRFSKEAKARMKILVANVLNAYRQSIKQLDWMSGSARAEALDKVSRLSVKVGAPDSFREYSTLVVRPDDLLGNIQRAKKLENDQQMARLVAPSTEGFWLITPQTVNAYYSAARNEIVFPAAVLQKPLFDVEADDAVNYGAIGAVIGHEIGHALDERGRYFDGTGAPRDWWKPQDVEGFGKRARALIAQFDAMTPEEGLRVNGALTLRENFGDLGGLEMAYRAWELSLGGATAPVIDGLTGEQRFFIGWAQAWRSKTRGEYLRQSLLRDPYAPARFRTNGPASNLAGFYRAFRVEASDRMYRAPSERLMIWAPR